MAVDVKRAALETPTRASVDERRQNGTKPCAPEPCTRVLQMTFFWPIAETSKLASANVARTSACRLPRAGLHLFINFTFRKRKLRTLQVYPR
jgi:hypothetical protein